MSKLIMMSILVATLAIPLRHVRAPDPSHAMKRVIVEFCWFNLFYVLALAYLAPRLM